MKKEFKQINQFLAISDDNRFAKVSLEAVIPNMEPDEASAKALHNATLHRASLGWGSEVKGGKTVDTVNVPEGNLELTEDRYVYKEFRSLSQIFLQNRGLDFSRPGVLKAAVDLMKGKTIYANHDFRDIDNWRGVIADAYWDEQGANSNGVPGINVKTKVDAFLNYRTACGLMMTPPAINACSATVVSEVEFSHPELVKDGTFWNKFLEEVDGEIVRLIATRIIEFWELSFVFLGEDRLAKSLPEAEETDEVKEQMSATEIVAEKLNATEKKTMKLTAEEKQMLGITTDGDEVTEQEVLKAALDVAKTSKVSVTDFAKLNSDLADKTKVAETLMTEKRNEVKRLATLAELGADEGTLNPVLERQITNASAEDLVELETYYRKKVGDKFPAGGRSSQENTEETLTAGGVKTESTQNDAVNVNNLHD